MNMSVSETPNICGAKVQVLNELQAASTQDDSVYPIKRRHSRRSI